LSENTVPASLEPGDAELQQAVEEVIAEVHPKLLGANVATFFAVDSPRENLGSVRISTEQTWWLSQRGGEDPVDLILTVNGKNWNAHSPAGRRGLVDLFLSKVRRKTGGKTVMDTTAGERRLYELVKLSLGIDYRAVARNPILTEEIPDFGKMQTALSEPAQFEIRFPYDVEPVKKQRGRKPKARTLSPDEAGEPGGSAVYREDLEPKPVESYYVKQAVADHGPAALRFSTADHRPETLTGVHYFNTTAEAAESADLKDLEYADDPNVLSTIETALEHEREEWAANAEPSDGSSE